MPWWQRSGSNKGEICQKVPSESPVARGGLIQCQHIQGLASCLVGCISFNSAGWKMKMKSVRRKVNYFKAPRFPILKLQGQEASRGDRVQTKSLTHHCNQENQKFWLWPRVESQQPDSAAPPAVHSSSGHCQFWLLWRLMEVSQLTGGSAVRCGLVGDAVVDAIKAVLNSGAAIWLCDGWSSQPSEQGAGLCHHD